MLNLPAQAGFRAEGAWHRAGAWGPCAAGKLAAAHTSPGRCSLRLSLLSSPHPVGGTETSLQDSRPLSGGHPSIRACLRGRQRAGESGAGVLDTPPTKVAPRWPHAPQTSRGTREPRTSPWESPGQGGGGHPTNPGGSGLLRPCGHSQRPRVLVASRKGDPGSQTPSWGSARGARVGAPGTQGAEPPGWVPVTRSQGHSRTGLGRWEQVRGHPTALAPSRPEHRGAARSVAAPQAGWG